MDLSKDEALDMIMGFPQEYRHSAIALAEKLAGMTNEHRADVLQAVAWIEKYLVKADPQPEQKRGRGPDQRPRKRQVRQVGSVTNAAEA